MKFKALFLVLLTVFSPAILAMDAPIENQTVDMSTHTIDPDDACLGRCHRSARNVPQNKRCLTSCCGQFICADEAQAILKSASDHQQTKQYIKGRLGSLQLRLTPEQLKQMYKIARPQYSKQCPHCNKNLSVDFNKAIFLKTPVESKPKITLIDVQNACFDLSPELSAALLKCETLHMHEDALVAESLNHETNVPIDFSHFTNNPYLKKDLIIRLAQLIKDPVRETPLMIRDLELFECAHFLGAPHNTMYLIANELWPLMQEQANDTAPIKEYKKSIRLLAKPHFACPIQLSEFIKAQPDVYDSYNPSPYTPFYRGDLSSGALLRLPNRGWYQDKNNQWYKIYPFCTLDGFENFIPSNTPINLTGHRIERLVSNILEDNSQNGHINVTINLDNNPITCIDESFFQALSKRRALGHEITISLLNTHLTAQQKKEYKKKFDRATQTLPQRYTSNFKFQSLAIGASFIGTALAIEYFSHKAPNLINNTSVISSGILGLIGGGIISGAVTQNHGIGIIGGLVSGICGTGACIESLEKIPRRCTIPTHILAASLGAWAASTIADHAALALAKRSHPDITRGDWNIDKFVWKNNYKITL